MCFPLLVQLPAIALLTRTPSPLSGLHAYSWFVLGVFQYVVSIFFLLPSSCCSSFAAIVSGLVPSTSPYHVDTHFHKWGLRTITVTICTTEVFRMLDSRETCWGNAPAMWLRNLASLVSASALQLLVLPAVVVGTSPHVNSFYVHSRLVKRSLHTVEATFYLSNNISTCIVHVVNVLE